MNNVIDPVKQYLSKSSEKSVGFLITFSAIFYILGNYFQSNVATIFVILWTLDFLVYYLLTYRMNMKEKLEERNQEKAKDFVLGGK